MFIIIPESLRLQKRGTHLNSLHSIYETNRPTSLLHSGLVAHDMDGTHAIHHPPRIDIPSITEVVLLRAMLHLLACGSFATRARLGGKFSSKHYWLYGTHRSNQHRIPHETVSKRVQNTIFKPISGMRGNDCKICDHHLLPTKVKSAKRWHVDGTRRSVAEGGI